MDKKALRSIPRPVADPEYYRMAKEAGKDCKWLIRAEMSGDVMQVIAWAIGDLRKDLPGASLRLCFGDDDYITQDLKAEKAKWYKGKVFSVLHLYWWGSSPEKNIVFADDESSSLRNGSLPRQGFTTGRNRCGRRSTTGRTKYLPEDWTKSTTGSWHR